MVVVEHGGSLVITDGSEAGDGSIDGGETVMCGVKMTLAGGDDSKKAELTVEGGAVKGDSYGIAGNGNPGRGNTSVAVSGGEVFGATAGIFNPQENSTVAVSGGEVSGATGVEMRSGTLTVTGGKILATADEFSANPNSNGISTSGAAVAVSQHTTNNALGAAISGGTLTGPVALYEGDKQDAQHDNVSLAVSGGTFEGDVIVVGANGAIVFSGCTFGGDLVNRGGEGAIVRVVGCEFADGSQLVLDTALVEATVETVLPKFMVLCDEMPAATRVGDCAGAVVTTADKAIVLDGVSYAAERADRFIDENEEFVDRDGREIELHNLAMWAEDGEAVKMHIAIVGEPVSAPTPVLPSTGPETVTIPVSGEENTVHAEVTVSGTSVEVKPLDPAEIEQVVGDDVQTGVVTIDLSSMDSDVTSVTLPVETLEAITSAAEDAGNDTESIQIVMPQGTVEIDDASMRAVLEQAEGSEVKLVLESVGTAKLNDEQLEAIEGEEVHGGFEAYFECVETGERIGDFKGGTATLSVPFDVPEGKKGSGFSVWYVSDEGDVERMKTFHVGGKLMWHVPHMSDYVVVYEDHPAYEDCGRGSDCPLAQFPDVKLGAWYHDGLHWAVENGVLKGGDDGRMSPNQDITREMLMVMLHRYAASAGMNTAVYEDTDVLSYEGADEVSAYAMTAMKWAVGCGVMKGYGDADLAPKDVLTREQTATFLHRFAAYLGMDVSEGEDTNILSFDDALDIHEWAMPAMQWACGAGIIGGYTDAAGNQTGELGPTDGCTRAQAATMLMRFDANA